MGAVVATVWAGGCRDAGESVTFACAAGWRAIVAPAVRDFEAASGVSVRTLYDGSGRLGSMSEMTRSMDLFLAADESYLTDLMSVGVEVRVTRLRRQTVRCVRSPEADDVGLEDLIQGSYRVSIASPKSAAVGRVLRAALGEQRFDRLARNAVTRSTVTEVAADVAGLRVADYGFVWNTTWPESRELVTVRMPGLERAVGVVALGRLNARGEAAAVAGLASAVADAVRASEAERE